jgi:hypothetical protein
MCVSETHSQCWVRVLERLDPRFRTTPHTDELPALTPLCAASVVGRGARGSRP